MVYKDKNTHTEVEDTTPKRKASEEIEGEEVKTVSKVAKRCALEVVLYEEPQKKYESHELEVSRIEEQLDNSNFERNAS